MSKYRFEKYDLAWDVEGLEYAAKGVGAGPLPSDYYVKPSMEVIYSEDEIVNTPSLSESVEDFKSDYEMDFYVITKVNQYKVTYLIIQSSKSKLAKYVKIGAKIEDVIGEAEEYPTNGAKGDYWYIRKEKLFPTIKLGENIVGGGITKMIKVISNQSVMCTLGTIEGLCITSSREVVYE